MSEIFNVATDALLILTGVCLFFVVLGALGELLLRWIDE